MGSLNRSPDGVIREKQNHCSDYRDQQAIQIQSGDPCGAKGVEEPAAHESADDPEKDVEKQSFTLFVHKLAADETGK
jgi:hypothetical protein